MALIDQLDDDALLALSRRTDELGVLSVYFDADPSNGADRSAAAIDLKNRLRELERRVDEAQVPGRALTAALDRLQGELESLADPREPGRGRMMFAALADDWVVRMSSQLPVNNRVVLDQGPFIHPLLEVLDEGRPAGVVVVSGDQARIIDWRLGAISVAARMERSEIEAPHERAGQIGGGPIGQYNSPVREQRKARNRAHAEQFFQDVVAAVAERAAEQRWERILVSGGDQWTSQVVERFPEPLRGKVISEQRVLGGLDDRELAGTVNRLMHEHHEANEAQVIAQVRDAGAAGNAALGLSEVASALTAGQVSHLVYDPQVRYVGSTGADGAMYAAAEAPTDGSVTPEPRLTERLVERALSTGARISPVEGAAEQVLAEAEGIAAFLRW